MNKKTIVIITVMVLILSSLLILLPSAASDGSGGTSTRSAADILVVQDGTINGINGETITPILKALTDDGWSYDYVYMPTPSSGYNSETQLNAISGWNNTEIYPSIFWICGDYYRKVFNQNRYTDIPTKTHAQGLANYVQDGGNVLITGNCVNRHWQYRPNNAFYEWVTHSAHAWEVSGTGGSTSRTYRTSKLSTYADHDLYNDPNILPSSWTYTHYGPRLPPYPTMDSEIIVRWGTAQVYLNNGEEIGQGWNVPIIGTPRMDSYCDIVIYDGPEYGNYGRTVFVNRRIDYQWDMTDDQGDILSPFIQNVAEWFGRGIPADVRLEPQSLNLDSMGNYVQVKVEGFPDNPNYSPMEVDGTSVAVSGVGVDLKYGTWNNNRFIGKADRLLVEDAIGAPGNEVEVDVNGKLADGTKFIGKAIIKAH